MPDTTPGWSALITSTVATTAYGLLSAFGTVFDGAGLGRLAGGSPWDLAWMFSALAWVSTTAVVAVMAWTFATTSALLLATAALTSGFRTRHHLAQPVVKVALTLTVTPLVLILLPFLLAAALWLLFWFTTVFGTCLSPECTPNPAVP